MCVRSVCACTARASQWAKWLRLDVKRRLLWLSCIQQGNLWRSPHVNRIYWRIHAKEKFVHGGSGLRNEPNVIIYLVRPRHSPQHHHQQSTSVTKYYIIIIIDAHSRSRQFFKSESEADYVVGEFVNHRERKRAVWTCPFVKTAHEPGHRKNNGTAKTLNLLKVSVVVWMRSE